MFLPPTAMRNGASSGPRPEVPGLGSRRATRSAVRWRLARAVPSSWHRCSSILMSSRHAPSGADHDETVRLAHAVPSQVAEVVSATGGYVAGLRGDGLYAVFGPNDDVLCVAHASACGALALDFVQHGLIPCSNARE